MSSTFRVRVPELPPNEYVSRLILDATEDRSDRKYNILTFATHERYQTIMAKTGHNFYGFITEGIKVWNDDYGKRPDNFYVLPEETLYRGIKFDFILSQSKFGQFQVSKLINDKLNLPVISLEHTAPTSVLKPEWLEEIKIMSGDINVFISEWSKDQWQIQSDSQEVVHHAVDVELFKPNDSERKPVVLTVANDFKNRDYCLNYSGWERITSGIATKVVGTSPDGLSEPASCIEELVDEYASSQVYLNTTTVSPIPTSLLEAMACGCAVVTTATCMIPDVVEHGVNGMISNDEDELRSYVEELLSNEKLRHELGKNARQTIIDKFSEESFLGSWNRIFDDAFDMKNTNFYKKG
jgi:glycosyltransferase involved in cell wall biosynthesis